MKFAKKHRKLFYVPGMISLVLIPVLLLWFVKTNRSFDSECSLDFSIADTMVSTKPEENSFTSKIVYLPRRNFKTISFDGENDENKIHDLKRSLLKRMTDNDTINGFKLHFGKHCTYQTFISAQDLLFIFNVDFYSAYKNDIYACGLPKKKNDKTLALSTFDCHVYPIEGWEDEERRRQIAIFIGNAKRFWQLPLALIGIALLNIFAVIKFNRNRIYIQKSYI